MNRQLVMTYVVIILLGVVNMIRGIIMEDLVLVLIFSAIAMLGLLALRSEYLKSVK